MALALLTPLLHVLLSPPSTPPCSCRAASALSLKLSPQLATAHALSAPRAQDTSTARSLLWCGYAVVSAPASALRRATHVCVLVRCAGSLPGPMSPHIAALSVHRRLQHTNTVRALRCSPSGAARLYPPPHSVARCRAAHTASRVLARCTRSLPARTPKVSYATTDAADLNAATLAATTLATANNAMPCHAMSVDLLSPQDRVRGLSSGACPHVIRRLVS